MATDIAFAIGVLALLGDRVPLALKIFLTALAVMDDLGAILTIAIFYSHDLNWAFLGGALGLFGLLGLLNRLKVMRLAIYLPLGAVLWYLMMRSGVHATISGVLLAFAIPFGDGGERSPSFRLQHVLHKPVAFMIMPLFALANTCVLLAPSSRRSSPSVSTVYDGPCRRSSRRSTRRPGSPASASASISARCRASARVGPLCGGSCAGTRATSASSRSRAARATARWPLWTGSKVPP